jgi:GNAT superfamily N-acetyltransferase
MSFANPPETPAPIGAHHQAGTFDCGNDTLNIWLRKFALANHLGGFAHTFVTCDENHAVLGYYTLAAGQVLREETGERPARGAVRHPIPVMLLARLAVDRAMQGKQLGRGLLYDAIRRVLSVSESLGVRTLLVHAKHGFAAAFYVQNAGFAPLPGDPLTLYLLLKDTRKTL